MLFDKMSITNQFMLFLLLVSNSFVLRICNASSNTHLHGPTNQQPLAKIAIQKAVISLNESAYITATRLLLGFQVKKKVYLYLSKYLNQVS